MGRRGQDDRPPVELWGAAESPVEEPVRVSVTPGRKPWRVLIGLAVVAALLVVLATTDGDDEPDLERAAARSQDEEPERDAGDERSDEEGRRSTTTISAHDRAEPTTTTFAPLPAGPVLGRPAGASVVLAGYDIREWSYVDLDTGATGQLELGGADPHHGIVPVEGGLVVASFIEVSFVPLVGEPRSIYDGPSLGVISSSTRDAVWVAGHDSTGAVSLVLVDLEGEVRAGPLTGVEWGWHGTADSVVHERGGIIFQTGPAGTRSHGPGTVLGHQGGWLVAQTCDGLARCSFERIDLVSGERAGFGLSNAPDYMSWAELSPSGSQLVLVESGDLGVDRLSVRDIGGAVRWQDDRGFGGAFSASWLPDSTGFVTASQGSGRAYVVVLEPEPEVIRLPMSDQAGGRVLVVPHAAP